VLELGAGSGLFARYFLNSFRGICAQEGRDFYDRMTYIVSDQSPQSVRQWQERELFAQHPGHVLAGVCDAQRPSEIKDLSGQSLEPGRLRAVFANYVLDVLPAAIVRAGPGGPEHLAVRTHLTNHHALLRPYAGLSLEEVRTLAASEQPGDRARLIPLLTLLEFETAFVSIGDETPPYLEEALAFGSDLKRVMLNHGAMVCLEQALQMLLPQGFILINDYGPVEREQIADQAATQRFGSSTALGLNFSLLEHHVTTTGRILLKPEGDKDHPIHTRLLCRQDLPQTAAAFANRYSSAGKAYFEGPLTQARQHAAAGRQNEALSAYRTALTHCPRDWCLLGECAEYVAMQLHDFGAGLELARGALELNPFYSAWLWNVLGDCLFCLERFDQAHEAYLQAQRISADDPRTNFNLAYTYFHFGCYADTLEVIARGLAKDHRGAYRERLLAKQQQVLAAISGRWLGEQERLLKRATAFAF
jgi:tetratricopeptide (TPR) repeat protein